MSSYQPILLIRFVIIFLTFFKPTIIHYREAGVGCAASQPSTWQMDNHRTKLLQLLVTCCSESLYHPPQGECSSCSFVFNGVVMLPLDTLPGNKWLDHLISVNNRHVLPMLVSLLNSVCAYNPGYSIP